MMLDACVMGACASFDKRPGEHHVVLHALDFFVHLMRVLLAVEEALEVLELDHAADLVGLLPSRSHVVALLYKHFQPFRLRRASASIRLIIRSMVGCRNLLV